MPRGNRTRGLDRKGVREGVRDPVRKFAETRPSPKEFWEYVARVIPGSKNAGTWI